jgi:uncharacterized protein YhhL (DUF1145 family)
MQISVSRGKFLDEVETIPELAILPLSVFFPKKFYLANLALAFGVLVHVLSFVIPNGTINAVKPHHSDYASSKLLKNLS